MNKAIDIEDLRLSLETHFFNKINPLIKSLKKKYNFLSEYEHRKDMELTGTWVCAGKIRFSE